MKNQIHKTIHKNHHRGFDFSIHHLLTRIKIGNFVHINALPITQSEIFYAIIHCNFLNHNNIIFCSIANSSKVENISNVPQQQNNSPSTSQPSNSSTMSRQSNGIWKTVDKAAMNRVGQRLVHKIIESDSLFRKLIIIKILILIITIIIISI